MNPLEAMARADFETRNPGKIWDRDAGTDDRIISYACARAAKNALADNVDEKMKRHFSDAFYNVKSVGACIAAAIRAAGEE